MEQHHQSLKQLQEKQKTEEALLHKKYGQTTSNWNSVRKPQEDPQEAQNRFRKNMNSTIGFPKTYDMYSGFEEISSKQKKSERVEQIEYFFFDYFSSQIGKTENEIKKLEEEIARLREGHNPSTDLNKEMSVNLFFFF